MGWVDTAGIDDGELACIPFSIAEETVAGGPWGVIYNCHSFADKAIEQRGFSDIRSADKRNNGFHKFILLYGAGVGVGVGCSSGMSVISMVFGRIDSAAMFATRTSTMGES